ncbi:MAG: endonuclease/exonuclease/phosphatase family metal-dependent hydrolase [Candidatus Promineifilaceae bacterium]|jgi:endonuclease/exonuclease/phosphatase family metal-dependent hydrolase
MRLLIYNIRYGTGGDRLWFPWSGYFRKTQANLEAMIPFIYSKSPDIVGLLEVDEGSFRSRNGNQAELIAGALGHYHVFRSKYGDSSPFRKLPVFRMQGNAFLAKDETVHNERFHYFQQGMKRLVIELELDDVVVFLVHLALHFRTRHAQLQQLYQLVKDTDKPIVIAGDFNALWGDTEIELFMAATKLQTANLTREPTFPSKAPKRQLDFILHSQGIASRNLEVPRVTFSDHLPMVWDFDLV